MDMKRYVLPDELGGGEIEAVEYWSGCAGAKPEYHVGGLVLLGREGQPWERVREPDPPEPAVGEFVACGVDGNLLPFFRRWAEGWSCVSRERDPHAVCWSDVVDVSRSLAGRNPLRLVAIGLTADTAATAPGGARIRGWLPATTRRGLRRGLMGEGTYRRWRA